VIIRKRGSKFLLISLFAVLTVATLSSSSTLLSNQLLLPTFSSSLPLLSFSPTIVQTAKADVNIDTSGNGKAAAFDGKNSISSDGKGFCNTVDNIAGGKFAPLFTGIVDCKSSSNNSKQFIVDYSVIKDPVKVGDTTYMTVAVREKDTGQPVSNVLVLLTIEPPNFNPSIGKTTTQTAYTDKDGHATFTVHIGPRSSSGIYNTNLEIRKDNYDSKLQKAFHVV
jgi:5-hydroxyisourate hydrolase-like protein (transthyretin family)